ncbi:MAG TPA: glutathione S-transferase family protein [Steroidobacteraceae bacterium]|nr:glutathione S-transferase family protein [Steroidobacteraceae bacterium]
MTVITLYTFGPAFGLPDPSPFVMKAEMLLKLSGQSYQMDTRGFTKAPKGKLPYIADDGVVVADSTMIRLHLEQKYGVDFDRGLAPKDRGAAWAVEKMLEDHFYWHLVYWRWLNDANFARGPIAFFKRAPAIIRPIVVKAVRKRVRGTLHAHGIGRHSEAENDRMAARAVDALSMMLGDNRYFLGPTVCGVDATVFAFVAGGLCATFDSPLRAKMEAMPNLVAYSQRMLSEFYPGHAQRAA